MRGAGMIRYRPATVMRGAGMLRYRVSADIKLLDQGAYVYFDYNIVHDDLQTGWCYRRSVNQLVVPVSVGS